MHGGVGGGEEGGEEGGKEGGKEGGRSKVEMCRAWTVGQATCSSEVYAIYVQCRVTPTWPGQAWAGLSSCKLLDTEQHLECYQTHLFSMPKTLRMHPWWAAGQPVRARSTIQQRTKPELGHHVLH